MRAAPVTSDWQVAQAMAPETSDPGVRESGVCWSSAEIAENLGITVFQITARLKGMEGRELVERVEGYWRLTDLGFRLGFGPEPPKKEHVPVGDRVYRTPTGGFYTPGATAAALPDDSSVPRRSPEEAHGWRLRYAWIGRSPEYGMSERQVEIFVDPEGTEWVRCAPTEPAELICPEGRLTTGLPAVRLRRRNGDTAVERKVSKSKKQQKKLQEHMEAQASR